LAQAQPAAQLQRLAHLQLAPQLQAAGFAHPHTARWQRQSAF
jgi:hypothetical protein